MAAPESTSTPLRSSGSQDHALPSVEFTFSADALSDPEVDRRSLTPTTQNIFQNLRLRDNQSGTNRASGASLHSGQAAPGLTPSSNTTYRDLYNATPSPAGISSAKPRDQRPQTPTSPLDSVGSHIGGLTDSQDAASESSGRTNSDHNSDEILWPGGSDENERDYLYNIRGEELPQAPIYDFRLQDALRNVRAQLTNLAHCMGLREEAQDSTTVFHNLYEQTLAASRFAYPATRTVGFIGDSGMGRLEVCVCEDEGLTELVGKSSVINSILDQGGLARSVSSLIYMVFVPWTSVDCLSRDTQNGDGAACTTVVTEFRSIDEGHPNNYTVEADFMDNAEVRELLEELLSAVRKYYTGAFREVSEPGEQENIRSAAGRAWNTLLSLFPDQPELGLDFVSQEGGDAVEPIITRLEEWAMAAQDSRPGGRNSLQYSVVANHADECMEQLDSLMADSRDRNRPASWPFVKLIRFETVSSSIPDIDAFLTTTRVYLSSPVLRTGLILADLPGMTFCICFLC